MTSPLQGLSQREPPVRDRHLRSHYSVSEVLRRAERSSRSLAPILATSFAALVSLIFFGYVAPKFHAQQVAAVARARELELSSQTSNMVALTASLGRLRASLNAELAAIAHLSQMSPTDLNTSGSSSGGGVSSLPPISIPTFTPPPATHATTSASTAVG